MKAVLLAVCLFIKWVTVTAQPVNILKDSSSQRLSNYSILPDSGYTFNRVLTDSTLPFKAGNQLTYRENGIFWIRILVDNPSQYGGKFSLYTNPFYDNTVYYFDQDAKKWIEVPTGAFSGVRARQYGIASCIIQGGKGSVLYVKMSIHALNKFPHFVRTSFILEKESVTEQNDQLVWTVGLATALIVLMFLLYNAVIFYHSRDRAYLNYMLIQLGGIIYCIAAFGGFNYVFPGYIQRVSVNPNGSISTYNLNLLFNRLSTVIIIGGYVQFARHYLQTKLHLPVQDKWLKWLTNSWIIFYVSYILAAFFWLNFFDGLFIRIANITITILVLWVLEIAILALRRRVYAARHFLWANLISLLLIMSISVLAIFHKNTKLQTWLSSAALVTQALMFAMALAARLRVLREELADKKTEAGELKNEIEKLEEQYRQLSAEHKQIEETIKEEKSRNEILEDKLSSNNRQLASASLYIVQKNELLGQIKSNIKKLGRQIPLGNNDLKDIESNLQNSELLDNDWERFRIHFEQVHPSFFENLKSRYPNLTQYETRLCAYFHMNLSTKEIAGLLNIDPTSVYKAKTRLGKKVNLSLLGGSEPLP